jgi:hypothetical protein
VTKLVAVNVAGYGGKEGYPEWYQWFGLAPQVGLEPTTLRLTALEIWFSSIAREIATRCDRLRYPALFQRFRMLGGSSPSPARKRAVTTDFDPFLESVGKELGKVKWLLQRAET